MKLGVIESSLSDEVIPASQEDVDSITGDLFHQPELTENDIAEILILTPHPEEAPYAC